MCNFSPAVCVCECSYSALLVTPLSRGELHASKWCRRTKDDRLRKEKKGKKGRNLTKVDHYLQGKRGVPTTGKFRLVAGNTIRAEAHYTLNSEVWLFITTYLPFLYGSGLLALHVLSHVVLGPVTHLTPLLSFGLRPFFPFSQYPSSTIADGGLCFSAAFNPWPLLVSNLQRLLAHGAPLAMVGY